MVSPGFLLPYVGSTVVLLFLDWIGGLKTPEPGNQQWTVVTSRAVALGDQGFLLLQEDVADRLGACLCPGTRVSTVNNGGGGLSPTWQPNGLALYSASKTF